MTLSRRFCVEENWGSSGPWSSLLPCVSPGSCRALAGSPVPRLERANQTSQGFCWEPRLLLANELALPLLGSSGEESPSVLVL